MKRIFLLFACVTALILAACGAKETKLVYETTTLAPSSISNSVTATGTIEPIQQVEVGTQVSGIISKIYVDFNSEVTEGQLIAEIDRSVLETEIAASKANLSAAKNEYDYQTTNYNRIKGLYEKDLVSASEFETAQYNYAKAVSTYTQAQSNYKKAEKNMSYTWIYSPINGVVLSRAVDQGQTVAAGFSTPTLFTIANDLRKMRVIADVDEADIGEVLEGQEVDFSVDAFPDDTFQGTVLQVRLLATTTSNVVTYEVVIDAPNPTLKLKPGLTANVTIYTLKKEHILSVPVRALRFTPEGQTQDNPLPHVWVQDPTGAIASRDVTLGVSDGLHTEVISGLSAGEKVIIGTKLAGVGMPEMPSGEGAPQNSGSPFMPPRPGGNGKNIRTK